MKTYLSLFCFALISLNAMSQTDIYSFKVESLEGSTIDFADFKGKKILIVNTASKCGYTPQYEELQQLWESKKDDVVIIGFPANNFGKQEPGTNQEIGEFCKRNYGVSFLMAAKVSVKGDDQAELFQWLTAQENPDFTGNIRWNFEKILIDENGKVARRFRSGANPMSEDIIGAL